MERPVTVPADADTVFMVSAAGNLAHGSITWNDLTCALPLQAGSMSGLRQNVKYEPRAGVNGHEAWYDYVRDGALMGGFGDPLNI